MIVYFKLQYYLNAINRGWPGYGPLTSYWLKQKIRFYIKCFTFYI